MEYCGILRYSLVGSYVMSGRFFFNPALSNKRIRGNSFNGQLKSKINGKAQKIKFAHLLYRGSPWYVYKCCVVFFLKCLFVSEKIEKN